MQGLHFYVIEALREENASHESELEALRNSLRYRLGGWLIEALPLGRGSLFVFFKLLRFYFKRRAWGASRPLAKRTLSIDAADQGAPVIVFGRAIPDGFTREQVWQTEDADMLSRRLDMAGDTGVLIIRFPSQQLLRRLSRIHQAGWRVVWHPEGDAAETAPALTAYVRAHADECRETNFV